ncbi:hypothetical protein [Bradyrhizobium sp.]|uniref:hypothetical protein n=1 Tax=Bradyrhizobium sp. TaxID=376 RepID=UPI003BF5C115
MWQLMLERLALGLLEKAHEGTAKEFGKWIAGEILGTELNKDEAYADRIKREFRLRDYYQAWSLYDSDRAYWKRLYGDDPLNSPNHPSSPPASLLPRPPSARHRGDTYLNPAPTASGISGPFGTGGQFAPGLAVSSRPLYETRSLVASSGDAARGAVENGRPVRQLVRVPDESQAAGTSRGTAIPFLDGTIRAQQVLDNSLPPPGAAPWDFSDRFGRWSGLGGVLGPVR